MPISLRGVVPILVTPFDEKGRIDVDSLQSLIDFNIAAGVHGLGVALGSEIFKFNEDERSKIEAIKLYQSFDSPKQTNEDTSGAPRVLIAAEQTPQAHDDEAVEQAVEAWRNEGDPN